MYLTPRPLAPISDGTPPRYARRAVRGRRRDQPLRCRCGCPGGRRLSCLGPGYAERCRSCWPPSRSARACLPRPRLFDLVFIVAGVFTLAQGPTLPWAARRLGVITPAEPTEITVEAAPLEELRADLLQAQIPAGSRLHGVEIFELRLPAQVNLALIVRGGRSFVPSPATVLQAGDRLLIVTPATARQQTERRLRAVSRAGKLAGWFGEHGL